MTRTEAKALGLNKYDGRPCTRGHVGVRYTGSLKCVECCQIKAVARYKPEDPVKRLLRVRRWRAYRKEQLNIWFGTWRKSRTGRPKGSRTTFWRDL